MSRFARASHVIWHCQYHVVWVPKYRYRILQGPVGQEVYRCIMTFCQQLGCEVVELNVQSDHLHLLVKVPPKLSLSGLMGVLKRRTAIRLFSVFSFFLRKKPYWGNHFWAKGYCVDTVGLNAEMIYKYVKYQENQEIRQEQLRLEPRGGSSWGVVRISVCEAEKDFSQHRNQIGVFYLPSYSPGRTSQCRTQAEHWLARPDAYEAQTLGHG